MRQNKITNFDIKIVALTFIKFPNQDPSASSTFWANTNNIKVVIWKISMISVKGKSATLYDISGLKSKLEKKRWDELKYSVKPSSLLRKHDTLTHQKIYNWANI